MANESVRLTEQQKAAERTDPKEEGSKVGDS